MSLYDPFRRFAAERVSRLENLSASLEQIADRNDALAKLVMLSQPLWLTPERYAKLSAMRSPLGLIGVMSGAVTLWVGMADYVFPQVRDLITPNVDAIGNAGGYWDPAWAEKAASGMIWIASMILFALLAAALWALPKLAAAVARVREAKPIAAPPLGYYLLTISGQVGFAGATVSTIVFAFAAVNAPVRHWLSAAQPWQSILFAVASLALMACSLFASDMEQIRSRQIFGDRGRALRYQAAFVGAPLLVMFAAILILPLSR